ncbi:MAG: hypothetical protein HFE59_04480 [Clostridiales bacterium]|nr:hypothetical protein [Clostridiales bacterium]
MTNNLSTSSSDEKPIKTVIFYILKGFLFIICLIPVIYGIGKEYSSASTENLINTYNEKRWAEFYELEKNSIDMVFLGSSHSYCTFDPDIFDNALNISSYQMGMPLQHPDSTYFTLLEVLNYQKPKVAVVEVYWDMLDDEFELKQAGMLFQVLKNKELENNYIKEVFPIGEKIKYYVNILKYQQDYFAFKNKNLKDDIKEKFGVLDKVTEKQQGKEEYRSKGYTFCNYNMLPGEFDKTNQFRKFDGKNWTFTSSQKKYLQKIIDICKEKEIELIFVTAPIANVSMGYIKNYDIVHSSVENLAKENNIPYLDYNIVNKDENLLKHENFRDDAHLNHSGVEIVDKHFLTYLEKNGFTKKF